MNVLAKQWRLLAIAGLMAASLASAPRRPYSPHEKAFYLDDATVEFVLPGLTITDQLRQRSRPMARSR